MQILIPMRVKTRSLRLGFGIVVRRFEARNPERLTNCGSYAVEVDYSERVLEELFSQDYMQMKALSHYLCLPFTQADREEMKSMRGWER